jgi:hypothetical protein
VEWANNVKIPRTNIKAGDHLIKIPNEGKRSLSTARKMKREGLKKGVSDLFFAYWSTRKESIPLMSDLYFGLWIEVKSKNGKVTKEQDIWLARMFMTGYAAKVVRSVDEGIQAIKDYLGMR